MGVENRRATKAELELVDLCYVVLRVLKSDPKDKARIPLLRQKSYDLYKKSLEIYPYNIDEEPK